MLCVSLSERTLQGCLNILDNLQEDEMAEVRVDLVSHLSPRSSVDDPGLSDEELKVLWRHPRDKIVTCRDIQGMQGPGFTLERQKVLENAIKTRTVQMVDVEYEAPESYRKAIAHVAVENNVRMIISYHNYEETPSKEKLLKIVDDCFQYGADIAKVAVLSRSKQDTARVLSLYEDQRPVVALSMGSDGVISRVAATKLGSPFTFVAVSAESMTAPHQVTLKHMRTIFQLLES